MPSKSYTNSLQGDAAYEQLTRKQRRIVDTAHETLSNVGIALAARLSEQGVERDEAARFVSCFMHVQGTLAAKAAGLSKRNLKRDVSRYIDLAFEAMR